MRPPRLCAHPSKDTAWPCDILGAGCVPRVVLCWVWGPGDAGMSLAVQQVTTLSPGALLLPERDQRSWCFLNKSAHKHEAGKWQDGEQPGNVTFCPRGFPPRVSVTPHNSAFVLEPAPQVLLAPPASSRKIRAFLQPEAAPEHPRAATGRTECLSHPPARVWGGGMAWFAQSLPCLSFPHAHPALGTEPGHP